jgi:type II secretory pathway predicted ATPase ExeA
MYEEHFGLKEKPFSLIPDADSVYFSPSHRSVFTMLEFGLLESVGITLITGAVGAGKTTLVRHLLRRIESKTLNIGLINTAHTAYGSLLRWIIDAFAVPGADGDEGQMLQALRKYLEKTHAAGRRAVVIIDEAQNISEHDLESLRLLTNLNADKQQLLQIVLVGQPELLDVFYNPAMSQLAQRVSAEHHLDPLSLSDTIRYVRHRMSAVGGDGDVFKPDAMMVVYFFSGGIPRVINTLCDTGLVFAYALGTHRVTFDLMVDVVRNKQIGGIAREGIDTDEARLNVRAHVLERTGMDLLDLVRPVPSPRSSRKKATGEEVESG